MKTKLLLMLALVAWVLPGVHGADAGGVPRAVNVSTRARVGVGEDTMIVGFVITEAQAEVLLRAVGPSLEQFDVTDFLPDPQLTIYDKAGHEIGTMGPNDTFGLAMVLFAKGYELTAGAFPIDVGFTKDAVWAGELPPGEYTMHVTSIGGHSGVALGEVYIVGKVN